MIMDYAKLSTGVKNAGVEKEVKILFEKQTIIEIKKVEMNARKEIDDKKQELRSLIGARYRDLLESADSIVSMGTASSTLLSTLQASSQHLNYPKPQHTSQHISDIRGKPEDKKKEYEYSIAKGMRMLMESTEKIWCFLDEGKHFEATSVYLKAKGVFNDLKENCITQFGKNAPSIPLLSHQWYKISQFPQKITSSAHHALLTTFQTPENYASSLATLILLDQVLPIQAYSEFLNSRKNAVKNILGDTKDLKNKTSGNNQKEISSKFCELVKVIKITIEQSYLILASPPTSQQTRNTITPPYLFSILDNLNTNLPGVIQVVSGPPLPNVLQSASSEWLENCETLIKSNTTELLREFVPTGAALSNLGECVMKYIFNEISTLRLENTHLSGDLTWDIMCEAVLGKRIDLWELLFSGVFITHSKEIIAKAFRSIDLSCLLSDSIKKSNETNNERGRDHFGDYMRGYYSDDGIEDPKKKSANVTSFVSLFDETLAKCLEDIRYLISLPNPQANKNTTLSPIHSPIITSIKPLYGDRLYSLNPFRTYNNCEGPEIELESFMQKQCYEALVIFVDDVGNRLETLQKQAMEISQKQNQDQNQTDKDYSSKQKSVTKEVSLDSMKLKNIIGNCLLIARVCKTLSLQSQQLPAIFSHANKNNPDHSTSSSITPPSSPLMLRSPPPTRKTPSRTTQNTTKSPPHPWLSEINSNLRQLGGYGFCLWATFFVSQYGGMLNSKVKSDNWGDPTRKSSWEPQKIKVDSLSHSANEENVLENTSPTKSVASIEEEEILYIPYQPSSYVMDVLFAICREIDSVGAHVLERGVLLYIVREFGERVYIIYTNLVTQVQGDETDLDDLSERGLNGVLESRGSLTICKEGSIQMLCDVCYLFDILSSGRDISHTSSTSTQNTLQHSSGFQNQDFDIKTSLTKLKNVANSFFVQNTPPSSPTSLLPLSLTQTSKNFTEERVSDSERYYSILEWRRRVDLLIGKIQQLLDPIDLAFYEPHIKSFVEKSYHRTTLLFGSLALSYKVGHSDVRRGIGVSESHNIIPLAKPVNRFQYLPITIPMTSNPSPTLSNIPHSITTPSSLKLMNNETSNNTNTSGAVNALSSTKVITTPISFMQAAKKLTTPNPNANTNHPNSNLGNKSNMSDKEKEKGSYGLWFLH